MRSAELHHARHTARPRRAAGRRAEERAGPCIRSGAVAAPPQVPDRRRVPNCGGAHVPERVWARPAHAPVGAAGGRRRDRAPLAHGAWRAARARDERGERPACRRRAPRRGVPVALGPDARPPCTAPGAPLSATRLGVGDVAGVAPGGRRGAERHAHPIPYRAQAHGQWHGRCAPRTFSFSHSTSSTPCTGPKSTAPARHSPSSPSRTARTRSVPRRCSTRTAPSTTGTRWISHVRRATHADHSDFFASLLWDLTGHRTYPKVLEGAHLLGGYDSVEHLHEEGLLHGILNGAGVLSS